MCAGVTSISQASERKAKMGRHGFMMKLNVLHKRSVKHVRSFQQSISSSLTPNQSAPLLLYEDAHTQKREHAQEHYWLHRRVKNR